jgi:hypothetical protein
MVDIKQYRKKVRDLLQEIHGYDISNSNKGIEGQIIVHIDIKDEKIWIQRNNTEINLADRLVEMGVVKEHIVIGFQSPFTRQFSGYAVG